MSIVVEVTLVLLVFHSWLRVVLCGRHGSRFLGSFGIGLKTIRLEIASQVAAASIFMQVVELDVQILIVDDVGQVAAFI